MLTKLTTVLNLPVIQLTVNFHG